MRFFVAVGLFATIVSAVSVSQPDAVAAQDKKDDKKKAQPKADPKTFVPDEATLKQIKDKTEELRKAVAALKAKKNVFDKALIPADVLIEVEIYLKAAENIVRFEEWLHANSVKWALTTLDQGLARAKQAEGGKAVWRDAPGKWVVRAYRSRVDASIQPYAVLLPVDYGKDPDKKWRLDIVLHGRDAALTEAKFIAGHQGNAPKDLDYIQLEPYGRGNNAYRWAGENDVFEAEGAFSVSLSRGISLDRRRIVLRGFSMGGAGTWHIGLHRPDMFCVIGPGAGFTTTHGYIANLPKELPDYQEKCLRIYDAVGYAENAFHVPVVAYSGEKDPQKKAADNIENALKGFKEPLRFTHLVAPGLEHQMPKEWQEKAEAEYRKFIEKEPDLNPQRVRFVTYTPKYYHCNWVGIHQLERIYEKAVVDAVKEKGTLTVTTTNVRRMGFYFLGEKPDPITRVVIDGQAVALPEETAQFGSLECEKRDKWVPVSRVEIHTRHLTKPEKAMFCCGPIDDAFMGPFQVCAPDGEPLHPVATTYAKAELSQFERNWERYFRGRLSTIKAADHMRDPPVASTNLVLFGDPQSNPLIAKILPKLPITWTKDELVVNGVKYDPKTHVPVLIYPNTLGREGKYFVLNSGHTFKEADLKGTNALLYPRLGDWAVIKPTPTEKDPAAYEVVAAGLFDENWQFKK